MKIIAALSAALTVSGLASAGPIDEFRLGVMQHNVCVNDCDNANKEDGPNLNAELVFTSPDFLDILYSPRPFIVASANLSGDTSFGGVGLLWNWDFAEGWSVEPGLGYVLHDGELEPPFPQGDPRNLPFNDTAVYLGSEDLFRISFALNRDFGARWGVQLQYEHLSHGQIIGNGRNQGMDTLGARVFWRFDD